YYWTITVIYYVFFFQAEDGIRDRNVTGVQTCALPIYTDDHHDNEGTPALSLPDRTQTSRKSCCNGYENHQRHTVANTAFGDLFRHPHDDDGTNRKRQH